ncbi:MAG: dihydrodipicolinate synthase family protein, partial [Planctomycetota bacterium]
LVARLASHGNIAGMKESGKQPERHAPLLAKGLPGFVLLSGNASTFARALRIGYRGGILALADVDPELCCALYKAVADNRPVLADELQSRLLRLDACLDPSDNFSPRLLRILRRSSPADS